MTGPEHYREAEKALDYANRVPLGDEGNYHLAAAQVHATLALAAATGCSNNEAERRTWLDVAS